MRPSATYLVCATARSGSTFLCRLLAKTGVAGMRPAPVAGYEYLLELTRTVDAGVNWEELDVRAFLDDAFERSRSAEGTAGFKLLWSDQVEAVADRMRRSRRYAGFDADDLVQFLPLDTKYVWLERRDRVAQAVSWTRARQSQCWSNRERSRFRGRELFDLLQIRRMLGRIERDNRLWERFFERNGIRPMRIAYEDLVEAPDRVVREILAFIGSPAPVDLDLGVTAHERRVDDSREDWVRRFDDIQSRGVLVRAWHSAVAYPRWVIGSFLALIRATRRAQARRARSRAAVAEKAGARQ